MFNQEYYNNLINKYSTKGLLVDTNLLLLYFIGRVNISWIEKCNRTCMFNEDDFIKIATIISSFKKVITLPNILTEVSNLSRCLTGVNKEYFLSEFYNLVEDMTEEYSISLEICSKDHFKRFGLTDAAILEQAKDKYLVFSKDGRLVAYLNENGVDAINYTYMQLL